MNSNDPMDLIKVTEDFGNDTVMILEILGEFLEIAKNQMECIRNALAGHDFSAVKKEAHSIKGAAANLCAYSLYKSAVEFETAAKSECVKTCILALENFHKELLRLDEFYRNQI